MPKRIYNHLSFYPENSNIKFSGTGMGKPNIPERPDDYYQQKIKELEKIKNDLAKNNKPIKTTLKISGEENKDFFYERLDTAKGDLRLLSIKENWEENNRRIIANVQFKNEKAFETFSKKLQSKYKGEEKQSKLCLTIDKIEELKSFEDLVTDYSLPEDFDLNKCYWIEIWLPNDEGIFNDFISFITQRFQDIVFNPRELNLGDRTVALIKANKDILDIISNELSYIAEIRFAKKVTHFFDLEKDDQIEILHDLKDRISIKESSKTISVILDTGVNRGNPLLEKVIDHDKNLTLDQSWGTHDESYAGQHGTQMAGICAYGDFGPLLKSKEEINISHNLASIKILSINEEGDKFNDASELVCDAINLAENNIEQNKNYVLAITTNSDGNGMPSLYSTMLDRVISNHKALFLVSIGNCDPQSISGAFTKDDYLQYQKSTCIDNPSQSWNSLSVGSYTEKTDCSNIRGDGLMPVSEELYVSPYSKFSMVNYDYNNFPVKPEVLFEGGNKVVDSSNKISNDPHLELITTNPNFQTSGELTEFRATSASTALAGRFASILMESYPGYWPETIKGLIVHSAEWSETMLKNRLSNPDISRNKMDEKVNFLRQCGFGIPDIEKARKSAENSLTLISQNEFDLFDEKKSHQCVIFDLPWPTKTLEELSNKRIKLKVTLSYFITPKAGSRGNKNKFKYQSHGLRFELKRKDESEQEFYSRVNKALNDGSQDNSSNSDPNWKLGIKTRNKIAGTILKDIWEGQSVDLATMDKLIVHPVVGWWKDDKKIKSEESKVRFSLILDIETEEESVNLYNEIKNIIEIPVGITVSSS